jgi:hypothetical protein
MCREQIRMLTFPHGVRAVTKRRYHFMPLCTCGCGEQTKGGKWLPGHDQKLRSAIENAVGGLESLRALAEKQLGHEIKVKK